ncbi:uncharacterized protein LOC107041836 [Diachasma alloeum]|uniref:uncharacterized protein LOC107041836 n=1 Tax=Diachasma alloeum TaxID=454923 RepID=UPI000738186D|nr:uncharacterized protein LOC107041836 [Diachasma alloeum]
MKIYLFLILCIMTDCLAKVQDDEKTSRDIFTPRKGKHHLLYSRKKTGYSEVYFNPLHSVGFLGGLQGLIAFVILKIKIVLVVITIIGATVLALKLLGIFKYSNYVYKSNYPIIEGPPVFEYGNPFTHDHKVDEWSSPSPYDRVRSRELMNEFLAKAEEIIMPWMNFSKECRNRTICQFMMLMNSSLDFRECAEIYSDCSELVRKEDKTPGIEFKQERL